MPAAILVVSGGHTSLYLVTAPGQYTLLGRTRDDAAGEAYDKVAKLLGLGYPGGPVIDRRAKNGNDRAIDLPVTRMTHADRNAPHVPGTLDFSYSGVKTAVLREVTARRAAGHWPLSDRDIDDLCASFQRVGRRIPPRPAVRRGAAGTVRPASALPAASRRTAGCAAMRWRADNSTGIPVFIPRLSLSTDNAAMIAAAGLRRLQAGDLAGRDLNADASLPL